MFLVDAANPVLASNATGDTFLTFTAPDRDGGMFTLKIAGGRDPLVYPSPSHQPASYTVLNFPVEDIEATVAGLTERGVEFEKYEGTQMETDPAGIFRKGGPLIAWFKDPSGNVLSVIEQSLEEPPGTP